MGTRRAPLDRLVDFAVAVPTCTVAAARRAVPIAARVGTLGSARLVGRLSDAVYSIRADERTVEAEVEAVGTPHDDPKPEDVGDRETIVVADLPIDGYDDLAARQVVDRLVTLDHDELTRVAAYERENRNRSTVLGKISMLTA